MALDFRASQIRTDKIIASGSTGTNALLLVYPFAAASNSSGSIDATKFVTASIGQDIFLYVSGATNSLDGTSNGALVVGGDVHVSGNLRVQGTIVGFSTTTGSIFTTSGVYSKTSQSVAFGTGFVYPNAIGTDVFFFVSGSTTKKSVFAGDLLVSGNILGLLTASFSGPTTFASTVTISNTASFAGPTTASYTLFSSGATVPYQTALMSVNSASSGEFKLISANTTNFFGNIPNVAVVGDTSNGNGVALVGGGGIIAYFQSPSSSFVSSSIQFPSGLSGSLTKLSDGSSFLKQGQGITVTSLSNGSITVAATVASLSAGTNITITDQGSGVFAISSSAAGLSVAASNVAFGTGTSVTGSANLTFNSASNLLNLTGTIYVANGSLIGTSSPTLTPGVSASIILGFSRSIFAEESGNTQRQILGMLASNVIAVGNANNTTHLSASIFDVYTNSLRRLRVSNAGAVSIGSLTNVDSGIGGTLSLGNNTALYFQDSANNFKQVVGFDSNNIIRIGENGSNVEQIKFVGTTAGVYMTFSRSFSMALGDDLIANSLGKPNGTIKVADQPSGSVNNVFGPSLIIRPGYGTGFGATGSVIIQGTFITTGGNGQHTSKDVAVFHGTYGLQMVGLLSASLPTGSTLFTGSIQHTTDTGQLWFLSGTTWKELGRGTERIMVAGALTTYATQSTPAMAGQFEFNPTEFAGPPRGIYFRIIGSVASGTNVTGSFALFNVTSGCFVDIVSPGNQAFSATSSTPTLFTSTNLRSAAGFYATSSAIYEVRLATSNNLSASTLGIAEMVVR